MRISAAEAVEFPLSVSISILFLEQLSGILPDPPSRSHSAFVILRIAPDALWPSLFFIFSAVFTMNYEALFVVVHHPKTCFSLAIMW